MEAVHPGPADTVTHGGNLGSLLLGHKGLLLQAPLPPHTRALCLDPRHHPQPAQIKTPCVYLTCSTTCSWAGTSSSVCSVCMWSTCRMPLRRHSTLSPAETFCLPPSIRAKHTLSLRRHSSTLHEGHALISEEGSQELRSKPYSNQHVKMMNAFLTQKLR